MSEPAFDSPDGCIHRFAAEGRAPECRRYPPAAFVHGNVTVGRFPPCWARCGEFDPGQLVIPPLSLEAQEEVRAAMASHWEQAVIHGSSIYAPDGARPFFPGQRLQVGELITCRFSTGDKQPVQARVVERVRGRFRVLEVTSTETPRTEWL